MEVFIISEGLWGPDLQSGKLSLFTRLSSAVKLASSFQSRQPLHYFLFHYSQREFCLTALEWGIKGGRGELRPGWKHLPTSDNISEFLFFRLHKLIKQCKVMTGELQYEYREIHQIFLSGLLHLLLSLLALIRGLNNLSLIWAGWAAANSAYFVFVKTREFSLDFVIWWMDRGIKKSTFNWKKKTFSYFT